MLLHPLPLKLLQLHPLLTPLTPLPLPTRLPALLWTLPAPLLMLLLLLLPPLLRPLWTAPAQRLTLLLTPPRLLPMLPLPLPLLLPPSNHLAASGAA